MARFALLSRPTAGRRCGQAALRICVTDAATAAGVPPAQAVHRALAAGGAGGGARLPGAAELGAGEHGPGHQEPVSDRGGLRVCVCAECLWGGWGWGGGEVTCCSLCVAARLEPGQIRHAGPAVLALSRWPCLPSFPSWLAARAAHPAVLLRAAALEMLAERAWLPALAQSPPLHPAHLAAAFHQRHSYVQKNHPHQPQPFFLTKHTHTTRRRTEAKELNLQVLNCTSGFQLEQISVDAFFEEYKRCSGAQEGAGGEGECVF